MEPGSHDAPKIDLDTIFDAFWNRFGMIFEAFLDTFATYKTKNNGFKMVRRTQRASERSERRERSAGEANEAEAKHKETQSKATPSFGTK